MHVDLVNTRKALVEPSTPVSSLATADLLDQLSAALAGSLGFPSLPNSVGDGGFSLTRGEAPDHHLRMLGFEQAADMAGVYKANRIAKLSSMQRTLLSFLLGARYLSGSVHAMLGKKLQSMELPLTAAQVIASVHQFPAKRIPSSWLTARMAWLINWTDTDRNRGQALRDRMDMKMTAHVKEAVIRGLPLRAGDAVKRRRMHSLTGSSGATTSGRWSFKRPPASSRATPVPVATPPLTEEGFKELEAVTGCPFFGQNLTYYGHSRQHFSGLGTFLTKAKGAGNRCTCFGIGTFFGPESGQLYASAGTSDSPVALF